MGKASRKKWESRKKWPFSKAARLNKLAKLPEVMDRVDDLCRDAERMRDEDFAVRKAA
jgi:hypothetical protein